MTFSFHPEAEIELQQAINFYENIRLGLGLDFAKEAYAAIQRAVLFPEAWALVDSDIHRSLVARFPYGILYSIELNEIFIVAVMNLHKEPNYWQQRR
jgi:hypothetical protein